MRANRYSGMTFLGLLLVLAAPGCTSARSVTSDADAAPRMIAIRVENQTREKVVVYFARVGSAAERLGRVNTTEYRVFRVPANLAQGARFQLHSFPDRRLHEEFSPYSTAPFLADGVREVRWVIRSGHTLSVVAVH